MFVLYVRLVFEPSLFVVSDPLCAQSLAGPGELLFVTAFF